VIHPITLVATALLALTRMFGAPGPARAVYTPFYHSYDK